jgi:hypothetical protein
MMVAPSGMSARAASAEATNLLIMRAVNYGIAFFAAAFSQGTFNHPHNCLKTKTVVCRIFGEKKSL